jgi:hypothetical protein
VTISILLPAKAEFAIQKEPIPSAQVDGIGKMEF